VFSFILILFLLLSIDFCEVQRGSRQKTKTKTYKYGYIGYFELDGFADSSEKCVFVFVVLPRPLWFGKNKTRERIESIR
jgi:hypothetical protein